MRYCQAINLHRLPDGSSTLVICPSRVFRDDMLDVMARQVITTLADESDGSKADRTVKFCGGPVDARLVQRVEPCSEKPADEVAAMTDGHRVLRRLLVGPRMTTVWATGVGVVGGAPEHRQVPV